jgi:predicted TIM-barrel fold metal-dependent hydrolase
VRFTTQPIDEPDDISQLWRLLEMMDAGRTLMFSSDYPHWDTDAPKVTLTARLPEHLRERIAWRTAVECFGTRLGL